MSAKLYKLYPFAGKDTTGAVREATDNFAKKLGYRPVVVQMRETDAQLYKGYLPLEIAKVQVGHFHLGYVNKVERSPVVFEGKRKAVR